MGQSTISMAMFNCYVSSPEGMRMEEILHQLVNGFSHEVPNSSQLVQDFFYPQYEDYSYWPI